jgi:hypothetical protein
MKLLLVPTTMHLPVRVSFVDCLLLSGNLADSHFTKRRYQFNKL